MMKELNVAFPETTDNYIQCFQMIYLFRASALNAVIHYYANTTMVLAITSDTFSQLSLFDSCYLCIHLILASKIS